MVQTPESRLKQRIRDLLTARGAFYSNVQGGSFAKPGDPDMVVCYHGRYIAIEAKAPDGRQSSIQRIRQNQIEEAEGLYVLAYSLDDVVRVLDLVDSAMWYHEKEEQG